MSYEHYHRWATTPIDRPPTLSVIIPAYDEAERIVPTIGAIAAHLAEIGLPWELIVSDDGSTDDTVDAVRELGLVNVRIIDPGRNRGKGAAVRAGVREAHGRFVLFTDADLSTPIEELDRLLDRIVDGADMAVASRSAAGSTETDRSLVRRLVSTGLRTFVRRLTGVRVGDTQCGFKLFTRTAATSLFSAGRVDGFSFDLEVLWLAQRWGLDVAEVPVRWFDAPGSKVRPARDALRFLGDVATLRMRWIRGVYPDTAPSAPPHAVAVAA